MNKVNKYNLVAENPQSTVVAEYTPASSSVIAHCEDPPHIVAETKQSLVPRRKKC